MNLTPFFRSGLLWLCASPIATMAAVLLEDTFVSPQHPQRQIATARGNWTLADGIATSTHDAALYAKNNNHGAVIWYDLGFRDAVLTFSFRSEQCELVGFTLNNPKGHVFRFLQTEAGLSVRAWESQAHGARATPLGKPTDKTPALRHGQWTKVELRFEGPKVTLTIGDFRQTYENAGVAVEKSRFGVSYNRGTFRLRDVKVESLEAKP